MAYRGDNTDDLLVARLEDLERRVRRLEESASGPPDPGWVLVEIGGELLYRYTPTGAIGPVIGVK